MAIGGGIVPCAREKLPENQEREDAKPSTVENRTLLSTYINWGLLAVIIILLGLILMKVSHATEGTGETNGIKYTSEIVEVVEKWTKDHMAWMEKVNAEHCKKSPEDTLASLVDNITIAVRNNLEPLLNKHSSHLVNISATLLNNFNMLLEEKSSNIYSNTKNIAFSSCADVLGQFPGSRSDYYYIKVDNGRPVYTYCDMMLSCGGISGGWRRVAYLNMSKAGATCPPEFVLGDPISCKRSENTWGCSAIIFQNFKFPYTSVCGKINGIYIKDLDGFKFHPKDLNRNYVDGVSLSHNESGIRTHIWTLAAGPCYLSKTSIPKFVGDHYSFDHGSLTELLWDDIQCPDTPSSHSAWFFRDLKQESCNNIELRLCRGELGNRRDFMLTNVEIYVH